MRLSAYHARQHTQHSKHIQRSRQNYISTYTALFDMHVHRVYMQAVATLGQVQHAAAGTTPGAFCTSLDCDAIGC
jgi:hypothetical protein